MNCTITAPRCGSALPDPHQALSPTCPMCYTPTSLTQNAIDAGADRGASRAASAGMQRGCRPWPRTPPGSSSALSSAPNMVSVRRCLTQCQPNSWTEGREAGYACPWELRRDERGRDRKGRQRRRHHPGGWCYKTLPE